MSKRLDDLERLAAAVEVELRAERKRARVDADAQRRGPGRPALRGPDDHGTERDYQAHRAAGEPACDLCLAGHALYNRRRDRERRRSGRVPRSRRLGRQLTIYDALKE